MITVIIPTYNKSAVLQITVNMVLNQTYKKLEIIIIDDASNDDTQNIVASFKRDNIIYLKHEKQLGTTKARLTGIKRATGNFIAFLDDDDKWESNKLALERNCFKHNNIDFTLSNYGINNLINNSYAQINLKKYAVNFQKEITLSPGPFFQCCLFSKQFIQQSLKFLDPKSEPSEDWNYFLNICSLNPKIYYLNKLLFTWNFSIHSQSFNYQKEWCSIEYIILKNKTLFLTYGNKKIFSLQLRRLGSYMYQLNNYKKFVHYYKWAHQIYPYSIKNIFYRLLLISPQKIIAYYMQYKVIK